MAIRAKQKLAYILHEVAIGGAELAFLSALPNLHHQFDLQVYVLGKVDPGLLEPYPPEIKRRIISYPYPSWMGLLIMPLVLRRIHQFRPDIVISSLWRSAMLASIYKKRQTRVQYFLFLHSSVYFHKPDRYFLKRAMKRADVILADSAASKKLALRDAPAQTPVEIVSMLINPSPATPPVHAFTPPYRILFAGRLHKVKNIPLAISAIAWLRKQGMDIVFDIYGRDNGEIHTIRERIQQEQMEAHIQLKGEINPNLKETLQQQYPFYLQLSHDEGMAMSVAEAMQAGAVCFVSPVGEIPAYAEDHVSAIFMKPDTPESWQQSLNTMMATLRNPETCRKVSQEAYRAFLEKPLYHESLINHLIHHTKSS
ncbi:Glycosyltransferase involved in cell wall bisynthesis [bacterium A37T11]|nr:Glycosyltransferase involved in cell wall bisynthesis [bacterium A37T11]